MNQRPFQLTVNSKQSIVAQSEEKRIMNQWSAKPIQLCTDNC